MSRDAIYNSSSEDENGIIDYISDEDYAIMMETDIDEKSKLLDGYSKSDGISRQRRGKTVSYEEAVQMCGCGGFQVVLLIMCGWAVSSDAVEVLSVSFLLPAATCDLSMTSGDKGLLNSTVFLGMMIGGYLWGSLADKWGRRNILIWSLLLNGIGNLASSLSQSFWLFTVCRCISGIGVGGSMPVVFTYFTEFQHKSRRGAMISLLATFWMFGNIVAAGLAWIVIPREYLSFSSGDFKFHSWRMFVALCTLPSATAGLMFVLMPESPKFLLQTGKEEEAVAVLKQIHSFNKVKEPFQLDNLVLREEDIDAAPADSIPSVRTSKSSLSQRLKITSKQLVNSTLQLFGPTLRRTTIILLVINFTLAFGYYGLFMWFPELFNRLDKYGGSFCETLGVNVTANETLCDAPSDVYLETFLTSISNIPGNLISILLVEKLGRKPLLAGSMVLSGLSVFFLWFVKEKWQYVLMSCMFGAISVVGFNMLDILLSELYPTDVRSTSFGVQTGALRIGAILGNIVFGLLVDTYCAVPMLLVAGLLAFGGLSSLLLPSTTGVDIH